MMVLLLSLHAPVTTSWLSAQCPVFFSCEPACGNALWPKSKHLRQASAVPFHRESLAEISATKKTLKKIEKRC